MKNKNGFTLIELLAVALVLGMFASIATPIVINTVNKAKKGAAEESADGYVRAVNTTVATERLNKNIIADGEYQITSDGNLCKDETAICDDDQKIKIDATGNRPTSGKIIISSREVKSSSIMTIGDYSVLYSDDNYTATRINKYKITYDLSNVKGNNVTSITSSETRMLRFVANNGYKLPYNISVKGATSDWDRDTGVLILSKATGNVTVTISGEEKPVLCKAVTKATTGNVPQGNYAYGDEYTCNLGDTDDSKNLTFFVLASTSDEVSLIMSKNVGNLVSWCKGTTCEAAGAKEELSRATADWNRITDKSKITLPSASQIATASGKTFNYKNVSGLAKWLYDYTKGTTHPVSNVYGYWTSTPDQNYPSHSWFVHYQGSIFDTRFVNIGVNYGVRPVITISKSIVG